MRRKRSPLEKAYRLYREKEYAKVIALLEPQVFMYRENTRFYHLLGLACLHVGDVGGAHSYLMRCTQIDQDAVAPRLALAACHFKRRDHEAALQLWLEILDDDPENKLAAKGLRVLRSGPESEEAERYRESDRLAALYPDMRPGVRHRTIVIAVSGGLLIAVAVLAVSSGPALYHSLISLFDRDELRPRREGVQYAEVSRQEASVDSAVSAGESDGVRYELSDSELNETFARMREYFLDERDNMANREINRVLHSNAPANLKERARTLRGYLGTPSFADFQDGFTYDEVVSDPWLYHGTYVRWRGRPSNVDVTDERIAFDFLVGYENGRQLDGIVPARFDFNVRIDSRFAIEILAQVRRGTESDISLRGVSVRILGPAEGS